MEGRIIKGIGGFYYVATDEGVIECRARGRFRHDGITPLVGDRVVIENAYVIEILPRKNSLVRPKVANVDQAIITFAAAKPNINFEILDRFLILTAEADVDAVICMNKIDLSKKDKIDSFLEIYGNSCDRIIVTSAEKGTGMEDIREQLKGRTTVFAGPSGVGKSSIINSLFPESNLKTGEVSRKISRGKHTTREAVLIALDENTFVLDTPGFTSLTLSHIKSEELYKYFREFLPFVSECKFSSCSHTNEQTDDCGVKTHVGKEINSSRYSCYLRIYEELKELENAQYD